jgi:hypothetical protein
LAESAQNATAQTGQQIEAMNATLDFVQLHLDALVFQRACIGIALIVQEIELRGFDIRRRELREIAVEGQATSISPVA